MTAWPCACSGERYCAVPMIEPGQRHVRGAGAGDAEVGDLRAALLVEDHVVRLEVAVDDAAPVREARGAQDLDRRCRSPAPGPAAPRSGRSLFSERPVDVLHRDVVGAVPLAAVEDADDVRVLRGPAALEASRRKRSTNSWSSAKWWCSSFTATSPPEQLVLRAGRRRPSRPSRRARSPVAAVDDRVLGRRGPSVASPRHEQLLACTALAIGAATAPPCRRSTRSSVTAIATFGSFDRREGDEPRWLIVAPMSSPRCPSCPRPRCPASAAAVPVPSSHDAAHHLAELRAPLAGFITLDCTLRDRCARTVRPSGSTIRVGQVRRASARRRWRPSRRPRHLQRRDLQLVLADRHAPDVDLRAASAAAAAPLASYSPLGRHLVGRVVERRLAVEAEALHVRRPSCALPSCSPTCAQTVLTECVSAVVSVIVAEAARCRRSAAARRRSSSASLPLTVESGRELARCRARPSR